MPSWKSIIEDKTYQDMDKEVDRRFKQQAEREQERRIQIEQELVTAFPQLLDKDLLVKQLARFLEKQ